MPRPREDIFLLLSPFIQLVFDDLITSDEIDTEIGLRGRTPREFVQTLAAYVRYCQGYKDGLEPQHWSLFMEMIAYSQEILVRQYSDVDEEDYDAEMDTFDETQRNALCRLIGSYCIKSLYYYYPSENVPEDWAKHIHFVDLRDWNDYGDLFPKDQREVDQILAARGNMTQYQTYSLLRMYFIKQNDLMDREDEWSWMDPEPYMKARKLMRDALTESFVLSREWAAAQVIQRFFLAMLKRRRAAAAVIERFFLWVRSRHDMQRVRIVRFFDPCLLRHKIWNPEGRVAKRICTALAERRIRTSVVCHCDKQSLS